MVVQQELLDKMEALVVAVHKAMEVVMVTHHQLLHHKEIMVVLHQQEIVAVQVEAVQEL